MYLLQIDPDTGLIKDDINNDGWKAITIFKKLVDKYDLRALTLVALSCDYLSPLSYYSDDDRPYRAMEELYESRKVLKLDSKIFIESFAKYKELQKNDDIEFYNLNKELYSKFLSKYEDAVRSDVIDQSEIEKLSNYIDKHNERMKRFNSSFSKEAIAENHGIASNGYKLSRIEQDIAYRRNSKFVNSEKELENPNKLGLQ